MSTDLQSTPNRPWLRVIGGALLIGLVLGYFVGVSKYSPILGFEYGAAIAFIFFVVRVWQSKWTVLASTLLVLATMLFIILYPVSENKAVAEQIYSHLQMWHFGAYAHRVLYLFLASAGVVLSLLIAVDLPKLRNYHRWFALCAAIAFALISAFDLGNKANQYYSGWRILNTAVMRYKADSTFTINKLIDAYYEGESTIGSVKPNPR